MHPPPRLRFLRTARQHALPGVLLLVGVVVTIAGWRQTTNAVSGVLGRLLDWAVSLVGRTWPLMAAAALVALTSRRGKERLLRLWRLPQARWDAAAAMLLAAGVIWAGWSDARGWLLALGGLVVLAALAAWALVLPTRRAPNLPPEALKNLGELERQEKEGERAKLQSDLRATPLQFIVGLAVMAGAVLAFQQLTEDRRQATADRAQLAEQLALTRQGQASERFTTAIEQLGSSRTETQLGGIYGLEQVARQAPDNRLAVTEVLVAYLRRRVPLASAGELSAPTPETSHAPDVQAALTVLSRRHVEPTDPRLDLTGLDLREVKLHGLDLRRVDLISADLRGADLTSADLTDVDLTSADLTTTVLRDANLTSANLTEADLTDADLASADLTYATMIGTFLTEADLAGANLRGANLRGANLHHADLDGATLHSTILRDTDLSYANLPTSLADTDLTGANLRHANLHHADLDGATLRGALADATTEWPNGFDWQSAGVKPS